MNVDTPSWSVQYIDELCISSYLFFFFLRYFSIREPSVLNSFSSIEFSFRVFFFFSFFFLRCNAFFVVHLRVFSTRSSSVIRIASLSLSLEFFKIVKQVAPSTQLGAKKENLPWGDTVARVFKLRIKKQFAIAYIGLEGSNIVFLLADAIVQ